MEIFLLVSLIMTLIAITFSSWHIINSLWLKPKKLESFLINQGFHGNSYRPINGDVPEMNLLGQAALSKPLPVLSHDIMSRIAPFSVKTFKKHGINSFVWFGRTLKLNIAKPELIREIFNKYSVYRKMPVGKPSTFGLVLRDGDDWAKVRRIINPAFHMHKLKNMLPLMEVSCDTMLSKWEEMNTAKGSIEVDVYSSISNMSGDAIARTSFGSCYEEGKRIFELQAEGIMLKFQQIGPIGYYIPGWRYAPTKLNRKIKNLERKTAEAVKILVANRESLMKEGNASKDDLLGIILQSNKMEIEEHGSGLSTDEVVLECKLFLLAGKDTIASLLTWTMVLLSQHQNWQAKAREEVLHCFGKDEKPDFEGLSRLKIVTMILHETLRFYPPVPGLNRTIAQDTKLKHISLLHGMEVSLPTLLVHRDPEIWGDDAHKFNPERFSEGISSATSNVAGSFFPFGGGPRICIGQNFALIEAKLALAKILQRYSFKLSPSYVHAPMALVGLVPQFGAPLILEKI